MPRNRPQNMPGAAFLASLEEAFELGPDSKVAAQSVADHLDLMARLQDAIDEHGIYVEGSRNQKVLNGAVAELRQARVVLSRLLRELGLEDDSQPARQAAASLAKKRWRAS